MFVEYFKENGHICNLAGTIFFHITSFDTTCKQAINAREWALCQLTLLNILRKTVTFAI